MLFVSIRVQGRIQKDMRWNKTMHIHSQKKPCRKKRYSQIDAIWLILRVFYHRYCCLHKPTSTYDIHSWKHRTLRTAGKNKLLSRLNFQPTEFDVERQSHWARHCSTKSSSQAISFAIRKFHNNHCCPLVFIDIVATVHACTKSPNQSNYKHTILFRN